MGEYTDEIIRSTTESGFKILILNIIHWISSSSVIKSLTPLLVVDSWQFKPYHFLFPCCCTSGKTDKKAHRWPPLLSAGNANHTSLDPHTRTLIPDPPSNHHQALHQSLFLALSSLFWISMGASPDLPREPYYVINHFMSSWFMCSALSFNIWTKFGGWRLGEYILSVQVTTTISYSWFTTAGWWGEDTNVSMAGSFWDGPQILTSWYSGFSLYLNVGWT